MAQTLDFSAGSQRIVASFVRSGSAINSQYSYTWPDDIVSINDVSDVIGTAYADQFTYALGLGGSYELTSLQGGGGVDKLTLTGRGSANLAGVTGVEILELGSHTTLPDAIFTGLAGDYLYVTLYASSLITGASLDASALTADHGLFVDVTLSAYIPITGGAGDDVFRGNLLNGFGETLHGGAGRDMVILTVHPGLSGNLANIDGVEHFRLSDDAAYNLTLRAKDFVDVDDALITMELGAMGGTINASAMTAGERVWFIGSGAGDTLTGGAGNDVFQFLTTAALTAADVLTGGAGHDVLLVSASGALNLAGVVGIEFVQATTGASNQISVSNANIAGLSAFGVKAGDSGDVIDASGVTTGSAQLYLIGGAAADTISGGSTADVLISMGGADTMTGGGNADAFVLGPDTTRITDFVSGQDVLVFGDSFFDLGASEGDGAVFDRLDASAFSTATNGGFSSNVQRFSFDSASHELRYAAQGSDTPPEDIDVLAILDGVTSVSVNDLFYGL